MASECRVLGTDLGFLSFRVELEKRFRVWGYRV